MWLESAASELAEAWLMAKDRALVTAASRDIYQRLRAHPESAGESRQGLRRILIAGPYHWQRAVDGSGAKGSSLLGHGWRPGVNGEAGSRERCGCSGAIENRRAVEGGLAGAARDRAGILVLGRTVGKYANHSKKAKKSAVFRSETRGLQWDFGRYRGMAAYVKQ